MRRPQKAEGTKGPRNEASSDKHGFPANDDGPLFRPNDDCPLFHPMCVQAHIEQTEIDVKTHTIARVKQ